MNLTPATCPSCSYALGSNWRHCERCREGMSPAPTAQELVQDATTRILQAQTALIERLTQENADLRAMLGRVAASHDPDSEALRRRPDQEPR